MRGSVSKSVQNNKMNVNVDCKCWLRKYLQKSEYLISCWLQISLDL